MTRIAVLVSGGGTNLQALIDAKAAGSIPSGKIVLVVSSKADAHALKRAATAGIPARVVPRAEFAYRDDFDLELVQALQAARADLVVLAGFLCILGPAMLRAYEGRIVNVHPSLIPSFCGDGYYGLRVHEAALERGVKITGATVHLVNEITDGGRILLQKAVEVQPDDTPESLQKRVMEQAEWQILPQAVEMMCAQINTENESK